MIKKVFLLGAYDRFNYGDLLFPIIVEKILKSFSPQLECYPYALIESDLSVFGARKTRPIRELYERVRATEDRVVIVAGGGVLGASWGSMRMNLSSGAGTGLLELVARLVGSERFNTYCQKRFGSPSPWPWIVSAGDFGVNMKVLYNGVGGSYLGRLSSEERTRIIEKLRTSTFLSVRDGETKRILAPIDSDNGVKLVPDSAVVMSRLFSKDMLRQMVTPPTREKIEYGKPFLCFQMGLGYGEGQHKELAAALDWVARQYDLSVVLLPIGRAQGHKDHIALRRLKSYVNTPVYLPRNDIGIYDIMALIAESALFIGTSLHGAVTCQSFAVPHLGLAGVTKLEFYLKTWEVPLQMECAKILSLPKRVTEVLALPKKELERNRDRLVDLAMDNFKDLASVIGIGPSFRLAPSPDLHEAAY